MKPALEAGFQIHEAVFSAEEVALLIRAIDSQAIPCSRAGARHVLGYPPIAAVARDARLTNIASAWNAARALPFKATMFNKSSSANWLVAWHQDTALPLSTRGALPGWGPWSQKDGVTFAHAPTSALTRVIALRIHLDDSTPDNGPLRALPGTHLFGVLTDEEVHEHAKRIAPQECCAPAGSVVAMRPLIVHASSKSVAAESRRVLHIEYAANLEISPGILLRAA
jgi:ectoine hydroxylase-related dioxygenase (phytanoyl-CoA dioxygenase family)